jgi:outer membrane protein OmpA-like peptidoglycan-associated protein
MNQLIKSIVIPSLLLIATITQAQQLDHYIYDHDTIVNDNEDHEFLVENLGEGINTRHVESGPIISPGGNTLYFFMVDTSYDHSGNSPEFHSDIYYSEYNAADKVWTQSVKMGGELNCDECPNAVQAVVNNGNTLLLSNHYHPNGINTKGLSLSQRDGGQWSFPEPIKVDFDNDQRFSAFMNNDMSILILAVHDKKSIGNQDLFVSFSEDKTHWSNPLNLGETINTKASEGTAFLAADGKTLYFSSNGHPNSIGGFDIYKSERLDDTWTNWSTPENIGKPYNTPDNEFYFTIPSQGDYSYLAHHFTGSDHAAHSDVVRIRLNANAKPKVLVMSGVIADGQTKKHLPVTYTVTPIYGVDTICTGASDATHHYNIVVPVGEQYKVTFESQGYVAKEITVDATQLIQHIEKNLELTLLSHPAAVITGYIINAEEGGKIKGILEIKNKVTGEVIQNLSVTAEDGYTLSLEGGSDYEVMASSANLLEDIYHLDLSKLEGTRTEIKNFSLHCLKCSFEIEDIFFAFNKADLDSNSFEKLDQVVQILKKHTDVKVEISAHTDAVGKDLYNKNLSQQRAESVVKYLVNHGVPTTQLVAKGYGEEKIRNKCVNGVECSDEEHEYNRRVEFKVLR